MTAISSPRLARTYLYVPGDRPERLAKSHLRGADAIIADLEDAVLPAAKAAALDNVASWLHHRDLDSSAAWVRINTGEQGLIETRAIASAAGLRGLFVPKVEAPDQLVAVRQAARDAGNSDLLLAPMIESATGIVRVEELAVQPGVFQLHLGEMDLAADLDLEPSHAGTELLYARSKIVVASRHAGLVSPAAPVSVVIDDPAGYRAETQALRRMGFSGRDCIHPKQVAIATDVFTPSPNAQAWARLVLAQATTHGGAFRDANGVMVDEAILRRARRLLAMSDQA